MNEKSPPQASLANLTIAEWLDSSTEELRSADVPSARLDSELILSHTLRQGRSYLHAHPDEILSNRHQEIANARLNLRLDRVPVAYIIGHKEFYGRRFKVTTATLVPRPESEELIELLTEAIPKNEELMIEETKRLVDVGTGSGILGVTAKIMFPELDVTLIDTSRHALKVAEENSKIMDAPVELILGDLLSPYPFKADYIIANLPYVDQSWDRSPETNHEPQEALFAKSGGLDLINKLIDQTPNKLKTSGYLILEADPAQHEAVVDKAKQQGLLLQSRKTYGLLLQKIR